jgi:isopentenyldiphosphate isomerase
MAELLDLYDSDDKPLGATKARADVHRDGDWHRTAHIYVVNEHGDFLVHLRSPLKDSKPNRWDTRFGGHVTAGMDYKETAIQELEQEIGLRVTADQLILGPQKSYNGVTNREHTQTYFHLFNGAVRELHFNDNEVVEVEWMSPDKIVIAMNQVPEEWADSAQGFQKIQEFYLKIKK